MAGDCCLVTGWVDWAGGGWPGKTDPGSDEQWGADLRGRRLQERPWGDGRLAAGSSAAGRAPQAGAGAWVSAVEISVSFWEMVPYIGAGETAPALFLRLGSGNLGHHQLWPSHSGRPSLTVVVFLDWTVIVCEVGGADKVCENKIPIRVSSARVCLGYRERIKVWTDKASRTGHVACVQ